MSWSGKVYCRCYQQGLWPQPPVPTSVIAVTGAGEVILTSDKPEYTEAFQVWRSQACAACGHYSQLVVYETFYYCPWTAFVRAARRHAEWPLLLSLDEQVEATGDSLTPFESLEELLKELRAFRASPEVDLLPGVIDARTRALLLLNELATPTLCVRVKNGNNGTGEVRIEKHGQLVFSSPYLEISRCKRGYTYRDLQPGSPWDDVSCSHSPLKETGEGTVALEVIPFAQRGADYAEVLDPLERLFQAALEMGHPIVWC